VLQALAKLDLDDLVLAFEELRLFFVTCEIFIP